MKLMRIHTPECVYSIESEAQCSVVHLNKHTHVCNTSVNLAIQNTFSDNAGDITI